MLLIVVQVVEEHQVVMFMILLLKDGLSLLEAVAAVVEVPGMIVEILVGMVGNGSQ